MDLMMPGLDGIAATAELKARQPEVEVVAITSFIEEERVTAALEAGASGFLLKDAEADDLAARDPLGACRRGLPRPGRRRHRRPPDARRRGRAGRRRAAARPAWTDLTARERDVLACLARGLSNRAIAESSGSPSGPPGPTSRTSWPSSA